MQIDPYAWLVTVPLAFALLQMKLLPQDHAARRLLRQIAEQEANAWDVVGVRHRPFDLAGNPRMRMIVFVMTLTALIISSVASLAAFVLSGPSV